MKNIDFKDKFDVKPFPLAIVVSRFNQPVTSKLLQSAIGRLEARGFPSEMISVIHVPGAVEIPLVCHEIAAKQSVDAIVTLGAVIRGETSHYDYVCQQVSEGCQHVSLTHKLPVIFGLLTTENGEQAFARAGGAHSDKGIESIDAAIEMVQVMQTVNSL